MRRYPDAVAEVCVADAGQPAFPAEGYRDGFGKGGVVLEAASFAAFRTVCPVRPCAVEIDPRGADKLRRGYSGRGMAVRFIGKTPFGFWFFVWLRLMKSDSIIQDCHCFVNPFWAVSADFSGAGCLRPAGAFPSLSPAAPAFSLAFAPIPSPLPSGKGRFFAILCKGLRPLHPRAEPARHWLDLPL